MDCRYRSVDLRHTPASNDHTPRPREKDRQLDTNSREDEAIARDFVLPKGDISSFSHGPWFCISAKAHEREGRHPPTIGIFFDIPRAGRRQAGDPARLQAPDQLDRQGEFALHEGVRCFRWDLSHACLCKSLDRLLVGIRRNRGKRDVLDTLGERERRLHLRRVPVGAGVIAEIDETSVALTRHNLARVTGDSQANL